ARRRLGPPGAHPSRIARPRPSFERQPAPRRDACEGVREGGLRAVVAAVSTARPELAAHDSGELNPPRTSTVLTRAAQLFRCVSGPNGATSGIGGRRRLLHPGLRSQMTSRIHGVRAPACAVLLVALIAGRAAAQRPDET